MTLTHTCAPTTFPAKTGVAHCTRDGRELRQRRRQRRASTSRTSTRARPRLHERRGAGDRDQEGRRRPVERHPDARRSRRRSTRSRTSPATDPPAATCRCRCSASRRSRASATTRSRTSTCRRSTTAARRTRGSASCRTATSWSAAGRRRRRVRAAALPERGAAEQRARAVLDRPQPAARRATIRVGDLTDGSSTLDRRRLGRGQELQQRDDPHVRDLDPLQRRRGRARPARSHVLVRPNTTFPGDGRPRQRRRGRSRLRHQNWGAENRDGTSGANIASAPANGTRVPVTRRPPTAGGSATITYDASGKKAGHVQARSPHDVRPDPRHHPGRADAHGHAVAPSEPNDVEGPPPGGPSPFRDSGRGGPVIAGDAVGGAAAASNKHGSPRAPTASTAIVLVLQRSLFGGALQSWTRKAPRACGDVAPVCTRDRCACDAASHGTGSQRDEVRAVDDDRGQGEEPGSPASACRRLRRSWRAQAQEHESERESSCVVSSNHSVPTALWRAYAADERSVAS